MVDFEVVKVCLVARAAGCAIGCNKITWGHMALADPPPALVFGARLCRLVETQVNNRRGWWWISFRNNSRGSTGGGSQESYGDGRGKCGEGNHFVYLKNRKLIKEELKTGVEVWTVG